MTVTETERTLTWNILSPVHFPNHTNVSSTNTSDPQKFVAFFQFIIMYHDILFWEFKVHIELSDDQTFFFHKV